jgi:beta-lactamase regulating signal transducer with metallopeptidase domain
MYLFYGLFIANKTTLKAHRWYLLLTLGISLLAPLNRQNFFNLEVPAAVSIINNNTTTPTVQENAPVPVVAHAAASENTSLSFVAILFILYGIVTCFFLFRLTRQFYLIWSCYRKSHKERKDGFTIVWNDRHKKPFSFFNLLFLNRASLKENEPAQVIAHEKVHIHQYHSIDMLLVELVAAFTWFNPVVWLLRRSVQLVHEYLADAGVIDSGIDKWQYQALLLNQVAETELVTLYSGFTQSSIHKRFIMMQKNHPRAASRYKLLLLVPVTAILLPVVGCLNGHAQNEATEKEVVTSIAPTKLNVLYIGVENPVNISVSEYAADDITVSIDNGSISGKNGEYIVKVHQPGKAVITVSAKGKTIKETEFRVKYLPPPVVALKGSSNKNGLIKGGDISTDDLLKAGGIRLTIENSEYELPMKIASFDMVVKKADKTVIKTAATTTDSYSAEQIELIKSLDKGQRVTFENIVASGPGGNRKTPMIMEFSIAGK